MIICSPFSLPYALFAVFGYRKALTYYSGFQINEDGPGYMFASSSLTEESVERVITTSDGLVTWHLSIRLDTMFQAVELPASIAHLYTGLAHMDGDTLTLELSNVNRFTSCRCSM